MGEIQLNLIDDERAFHGTVHEHLGQALMATLTAEPETIGELENALRRFVVWESDSPLAGLRAGEDLGPAEAGLLAIDMTSRTICAAFPQLIDDDGVKHVWIETPLGDDDGTHVPFFLSREWLITESLGEFIEMVDARRAARKTHPTIDYRAVMYGPPLMEFLAKECAGIRPPETPPESMEQDPAVAVHLKWYMTPRTDLGGKTPRDVLLYHRNFVDREVQWREYQWSLAKQCPPHLPTDTNAYRHGGFGTHEWVVYYYMMRNLLDHAIFDGDRTADPSTEAARLSALNEVWLDEADPERSYRAPRGIIESERRRIPVTMSAREILIDEDCPCCQMTAEDFGTPMFWHLDGCNMDECFEFSHHEKREDWEAEQKEWAEMSAKYARERAERGEEEFIAEPPGEYLDAVPIDGREDDVPF